MTMTMCASHTDRIGPSLQALRGQGGLENFRNVFESLSTVAVPTAAATAHFGLAHHYID